MRRNLSFLLFFLLTMFSTAWADEETKVASVTINGTTTEYPDFISAWYAACQGTSASPATLTLLADVRYTNYGYYLNLPSDKSVTFVGDSHTLTITEDTYMTVNGTFIMNSGTIKFSDSESCGYAMKVNSTGVVEVNGGTIDASESDYSAITTPTDEDCTGHITINGDTIKGNSTSGYAIDYYYGTVTLNGGCFTGGSGAIRTLCNSTAVSSLLGTGRCFIATDNSISDGYPYLSASGTSLDNTSVTVLYPEASTVVSSTKTVYKNFQNAWTAVNKASSSGAYLYLLKDVTIASNLTPTLGSYVTLVGDNNTLTYTGSDDAMFHLDMAHSGVFTILSGKYIAQNSDVILIANETHLTIKGGEYTTQGTDKNVFNISNSTYASILLYGGTYHYSGTVDATSGYCGGFSADREFNNFMQTTYALYYYDDNGNMNSTPVLHSEWSTATTLRRAFTIKACDNSSVTGTSCDYCGYTGTRIATIDGGVYGYHTLESAFAGLTKDGQEIKVINDNSDLIINFSDNSYATVNYNATLDINGSTIKGNRLKDQLLSGLFHVAAGKTLTLTDSGTTKGTITNNGSGIIVSLASDDTTGGGVNVTTTAAINVEANNNSVVKGNIDSLSVNSGTITTTSDINVKNIAFNGGSLITDGGTFTQTKSPADTDNLTIAAGTFSFNPETWTRESSSITDNTGTWTVTAHTYPAKLTIGNKTTRQTSMADALTAANKATEAAKITLIDSSTSVEGTYAVTSTYGVTIEGDGYTWTLPSTLTVSGKLIFNSGTLCNTIASGTALNLTGTLEMNGGTISASTVNAIDIANTEARLSVTGGNITGGQSALSVTSALTPTYIRLTGGQYTPGTGYSALVCSQKTVADLLAKGYDYYLSDGTIQTGNGTTLPNGAVVTVQAPETLTVDNITYTITRLNGTRQSKATGEWVASSGLYTAAVSGFATTPTESTTVSIPAQITDPYNNKNTFDVDSIATCAFSGQSYLTGISLSDKILGIGVRAFQNTSLTEITIPENVEWLDDNAFDGITTLATINYNTKKVQNTDYTETTYPFYSADRYATALNIGANVLSIPAYMFYNFDSNESSGTVTGLVTSVAASAPTIDTNTFSSWVKSNCTLSTPNATTGDNITSYEAWGFTKRSLSTLVLSDTQTTVYAGTYNTGKVSYNRSGLTSGNYGSFAVPFSYTVGTSTTGISKAYQPIGISLYKDLGTTYKLSIYFDEVTEVSAGYPILAKLSSETVALTSNAETTITSDAAGQTISSDVYQLTDGAITVQDATKTVTFGGTYVQKTTVDGSSLWAFNTDGSFAKADEYVNPFRAYILCNWDFTSGAKGMVIEGYLGGEETAIPLILSDDGSFDTISGNIYDLNGRNLGTDINALPRGMYIINGKKVCK